MENIEPSKFYVFWEGECLNTVPLGFDSELFEELISKDKEREFLDTLPRNHYQSLIFLYEDLPNDNEE